MISIVTLLNYIKIILVLYALLIIELLMTSVAFYLINYNYMIEFYLINYSYMIEFLTICQNLYMWVSNGDNICISNNLISLILHVAIYKAQTYNLDVDTDYKIECMSCTFKKL